MCKNGVRLVVLVAAGDCAHMGVKLLVLKMELDMEVVVEVLDTVVLEVM